MKIIDNYRKLPIGKYNEIVKDSDRIDFYTRRNDKKEETTEEVKTEEVVAEETEKTEE